ncbi:MAG: S8 family serine peptidase [Actinomycetota bacterium]|nr:S8 family serine peptidase [Actinomycetota bacterium]
MRSARRRVAGAIAPLLAVTALTVSVTSAQAATGSSHGFTAKALSATSIIDAAKSTSGRLAQSDQALLKRHDRKLVGVVVKLDYDATASYAGNIRGLAATSPKVTGRMLTGKSPAETAYAAYTGAIDATFRRDVAQKIKGAKLGRSLTTVYGGVALRLPANQAATLLKVPNVAAVQSDTINKLQTDASTTFIGAPTLWAREGGQPLAGKGVIFGDLDSGLWPEHPSFADNGVLPSPPAKADGTPRTCSFGDNPLTPATDVFACNHKLIGGQPFLATYNALIGHEVYPTSARDSDGHGTHTSSTAAGDVVAHAPIFGIDRGPISGVAPGAWVIEYKVCGAEGCFGSDSAAAVGQAILDGVNVINFSISGGSSPFTDPVELAFRDAYAAGVTVAASAGNSGPAAGTTDHRSPWVITVAASTQTREFQSTLTLADGAATTTLEGSSLTHGVSTPTPVVLAENVPGYTGDKFCGKDFPAASLTGKIVACARGGFNGGVAIGRVEKGFRAKAAGAVGMVLYNPTLADTETDNHFLPTVHLADGTAFLAFMAAHPAATASFTDGVKANGQGDVMASFSSRGPGGAFLKPDITAPGVQILAGNTPTPDAIPAGPAGEYFQAIAGTSMAAPHIAGSAILLKALHPTWGPGAVKSALMTSAKTSIVKEDTTTPADPFDDGAGRVDLTKAGDVPIVFQDTAANMTALGTNPLTAINVNTPSVNLPTMSGSATVTRTATNLTTKAYKFKVTTSAPTGSTIAVSPKEGTIRPGQSKTFRIQVSSTAPAGQYFGQINFTSSGNPALHLPVAFKNGPGNVTLSQACAPASIPLQSSTTCTLTAANPTSTNTAAVTATTEVSNGLKITGASAGTVALNGRSSAATFTLAGKADPAPSIAPGPSPFGYLDLGGFGITPTAIGDDANQNYNTGPITLGGQKYTSIGVDSNGYIVLGGATSSADIAFRPQNLPNPARPNNVLAAYWTDLDGSGSPGISVAGLKRTSTGDTWIVVQWDVHVFGDHTAAGKRQMQVWLGTAGHDDISYTYNTGTEGAGAPAAAGLTVGAESPNGQFGDQIAGPPAGDYVITATPGTPGETKTWTVTAKGIEKGAQSVTTSMVSNLNTGTTVVSSPVTVTRR